jgi:hypothetical protein
MTQESGATLTLATGVKSTTKRRLSQIPSPAPQLRVQQVDAKAFAIRALAGKMAAKSRGPGQI